MRLPGGDATELDLILFEQCGVLSRSQAVELVGESSLRHNVAKGRWRKILRGVYLTESGPMRPEQQWWVAVLAAGAGALLAGLAAARAAGLRGRWRRDVIDVLRPPDRGAPCLTRKLPTFDTPLVIVHRSTRLDDQDIQRGRPDRTTTARSLVDAAGWALDDAEAASIISAGCQQRIVAPEQVIEVATRLTRIHRRDLILSTARFAELGATSSGEIGFLQLCRRYRLPAPRLQVMRTDRAGTRRFLDAYFEAYGVHVEIDGAQHLDVRNWAADLKRQNDLWIAGDRILRFPAYLIRANPDEVARQVREALCSAGWNGQS